MIAHRAFFLPLLLITLASAGTSNIAPATGRFGIDCGPPERIGLWLEGLPNNERAHLFYYGADNLFHWKPPLHQPLQFVAETGIATGMATVTFDRFKAREASGTYSLSRRDGGTQTGNFHVKRLKHTKNDVCE